MAKQYTMEFKEKVVKESLETGNVYLVARRYDISPSTIHQWVDNYNKHGAISKRNINKEIPRTQNKLQSNLTDPSQAKENEALKKLLGEKELEIQILKDLLKKTNPHLLTKLK